MIRRVLIADRGEIARRIIATCRAVGVETVAVYSDLDDDSPHLAEADYAVRLDGEPGAGEPTASGPGAGEPTASGPGAREPTASGPGAGESGDIGAANDAYQRRRPILAAARRCGADAIHPGCGPLAEDPDFAAAVIDAGLTWIGPSPKAIAVLGCKPDAKALVGNAGVATLPEYLGSEHAPAFPIMAKPTMGRGGRGMRVVRDPEPLAETLALAGAEETVFYERFLERARHVEVQIVADCSGTVVALGERECSIQRRHQAIIDESPSPAVGSRLRTELCAAAVAAARAVGYVGVGTVEFLLGPSGEYFFLEMSPRLPVQHPVTECVLGVDLVRLQLLIAEGGALPFSTPPPIRGHAIEVQLAAEDPAYAWRACRGTVRRFEVPGVVHRFGPLLVPGLRLDGALAEGPDLKTRAGTRYDPLLAKVVAWAPTRHEAARLLATALTRARIHGITTNRDLLVRVLRNRAFLIGDIDTGFLDRTPEVFAPLLSSLDAVRLSCLAAALAGAARRRAAVPALASLPPGWRNVPSVPQTVAYDGPTGTMEVAYRFGRSGEVAAWCVRAVDRDEVGLPGTAPDDLDVAIDHPRVTVVGVTPTRVELDVAGVRMAFAVHEVEGAAAEDNMISYVDSSEGSVTLTELPRFPLPALDQPGGSLLAPLPGTVGRVLVVPGQRVAAGDLLFTVEAATLEHPVHAPSDGVVGDLWVSTGSPVEAGALLGVLTLD